MLHLFTEARLRNVKADCCAADIAFFGNDREVFEVTEIDWV